MSSCDWYTVISIENSIHDEKFHTETSQCSARSKILCISVLNVSLSNMHNHDKIHEAKVMLYSCIYADI